MKIFGTTPRRRVVAVWSATAPSPPFFWFARTWPRCGCRRASTSDLPSTAIDSGVAVRPGCAIGPDDHQRIEATGDRLVLRLAMPDRTFPMTIDIVVSSRRYPNANTADAISHRNCTRAAPKKIT